MMRNWKLCGAAALGLGMTMSTALTAAVTLTIDNLKVPAGVTAEVGVYASSNSGDIISGFNLPLDINDDGFTNGTLPAGFKVNATPLQNKIYANTGFDTPQPQITLINADGIPTGSGANVQLSSTPRLLFDIAIDVASNVSAGTVLPMEIFIPNAPFASLFNVAGPNSPTVASPTSSTPVFGSVTVTAVPEPSAGLALMAASVACLRRRSKRACA